MMVSSQACCNINELYYLLVGDLFSTYGKAVVGYSAGDGTYSKEPSIFYNLPGYSASSNILNVDSIVGNTGKFNTVEG